MSFESSLPVLGQVFSSALCVSNFIPQTIPKSPQRRGVARIQSKKLLLKADGELFSVPPLNIRDLVIHQQLASHSQVKMQDACSSPSLLVKILSGVQLSSPSVKTEDKPDSSSTVGNPKPMFSYFCENHDTSDLVSKTGKPFLAVRHSALLLFSLRELPRLLSWLSSCSRRGITADVLVLSVDASAAELSCARVTEEAPCYPDGSKTSNLFSFADPKWTKCDDFCRPECFLALKVVSPVLRFSLQDYQADPAMVAQDKPQEHPDGDSALKRLGVPPPLFRMS